MKLILLAHNDDELFCIPLLKTFQKEGIHFKIVFMTHGSSYGIDSDQRISESKKLLQHLKIPNEAVIYLGKLNDIKDCTLHKNIEQVWATLETIILNLEIDEVITPIWEGGHHDHDTTSYLGHLVSRNLGVTHSEYSLYNGLFWPYPLFSVSRVDTKSNDQNNSRFEKLKFSLMEGIKVLLYTRFYPSQWKTFLGLSFGMFIRFIVIREITIKKSKTTIFTNSFFGEKSFYAKRFGVPEIDVKESIERMEEKLN